MNRASDPGAPWVETPYDMDYVIDFGQNWICRPCFDTSSVVNVSGLSLPLSGSLLLRPKGVGMQVLSLTGEVPMFLDLQDNIITRSPGGLQAVAVKTWDILLRSELGPEPILLVSVSASDPRAKVSESKDGYA